MFVAVLSLALFYMNFCITADFIFLIGKYTFILIVYTIVYAIVYAHKLYEIISHL